MLKYTCKSVATDYITKLIIFPLIILGNRLGVVRPRGGYLFHIFSSIASFNAHKKRIYKYICKSPLFFGFKSANEKRSTTQYIVNEFPNENLKNGKTVQDAK